MDIVGIDPNMCKTCPARERCPGLVLVIAEALLSRKAVILGSDLEDLPPEAFLEIELIEAGDCLPVPMKYGSGMMVINDQASGGCDCSEPCENCSCGGEPKATTEEEE